MKSILITIALFLSSCSTITGVTEHNKTGSGQDYRLINDIPVDCSGTEKLEGDLYNFDTKEWTLPTSDSVFVGLGRGCWINVDRYDIQYILHTDTSTVIGDSCQWVRGYYFKLM